MDFDPSDEQQAIRTLARDFAVGEVRPVAEELDRTKSFPYEIVGKLGELGLMGIPYPEEHGGGGADNLSYALVVEELARIDSSVAITVAAHTSLGTWPIYAFGSDEQKREWLPRLCAGETLGAFGLTEPEAGSDAGNTRTTASLEDDAQWVINGSKQFIRISHELGHWCLHREGGAVWCRSHAVDPDDGADARPRRAYPPEESEANEFAAALLMPAHLVQRHYERLRRRDPDGCFQQLCRIFGASGAAMSRRLRSLVPSPGSR